MPDTILKAWKDCRFSGSFVGALGIGLLLMCRFEGEEGGGGEEPIVHGE